MQSSPVSGRGLEIFLTILIALVLVQEKNRMLKRSFAKLNQAMGLQSNKQKSHPVSDRTAILRASKLLNLGNNQVVFSDNNHSTWLVEHPSAMSSFDQMMKEAKGKKIVVFLDYDGTLSHIVDDPDLAFMSDEMRAAVREVGKYFPTAIISGRSRDKVKQFVQLSNVFYAGSHGMDIIAPPRRVKTANGKHHTISIDQKVTEFKVKNHEYIPIRDQTDHFLFKGNEVLFQPAKKFLPAIQKMLVALTEKTMKIQGSRIEDNRFCISVHFRQVKEEDFGRLEEAVKSVLEHYPEFHVSWGKKVMEIRPSIEWDKGHALEYLLDTLGLSTSADVLPLYIGDDRTDDDAFKVIKRKGQGYSIIVSSIPKETEASYSLNDPSEVLTFLLRLARWRKSSSSSRSLAQIYVVGT